MFSVKLSPCLLVNKAKFSAPLPRSIQEPFNSNCLMEVQQLPWYPWLPLIQNNKNISAKKWYTFLMVSTQETLSMVPTHTSSLWGESTQKRSSMAHFGWQASLQKSKATFKYEGLRPFKGFTGKTQLILPSHICKNAMYINSIYTQFNQMEVLVVFFHTNK